MAMDVICPSCGYRNPPGGDSCESCNFPLTPTARNVESSAEPAGGSVAGAPAYEPPRRRLVRPQRRGAPLQGQSMWLWLLFGTFAAGLLVWTAIDASRKRATPPPVAGSNNDQQHLADQARTALAADSSDIEAHLALANVLYDTGNWDEAIVHYRAVLRRDSTRVSPIVDLGVCYYSLGDADQAEGLFQRALRLDPHQPVALFNMGVVNERRGEAARALEFYHRALQNAPSDEMKATIVTAVQRTSQLSGKKPPPLTPPAGGAVGP
jgi:tetratricopeptide (TPR) repeat protein